jgi:hypothetical protein
MEVAWPSNPGELDALDGSRPRQDFSMMDKHRMNDSRNRPFKKYV